jgi:hypothetical protein
MSQYFFHIDDGTPPLEHEAVEAATLEDAKCLAVKLAGQSICDAAGGFWDMEEWRLTATDEAGLTLFSLHLAGIEAPCISTGEAPMILVRPISG